VTAYQAGDTVDAMLARVDTALYRAKREGRNCIRVAGIDTRPRELVAAE
jgi:PleD family two-component response regulator